MGDLILGTGGLSNSLVQDVVSCALKIGYRSIDTAATYMNESEIRKGVAESGVDPEDVAFISKFPEQLPGRESEAIERTLALLGRDSLDTWLVHGPATMHVNRKIWKKFIEIRDQGLVRHIGVSNYSHSQIVDLCEFTGVAPEFNQIPIGPGQPSCSELQKYSSMGVRLIGYSVFHPCFLSRLICEDSPRGECGNSEYGNLIRWHRRKNYDIIVRSTIHDHLVRNWKNYYGL